MALAAVSEGAGGKLSFLPLWLHGSRSTRSLSEPQCLSLASGVLTPDSSIGIEMTVPIQDSHITGT